MRLRKVLSLALALCLLMTLLPLQTFASAENRPDKQAPLYADWKDFTYFPEIQIQEVTPAQAETPEASDALWEGAKTYAPTYLTQEQATKKLLEYLKARKTSFDLYVKSDNSEYGEVVREMLTDATVHTGKPTEGDYLLWQLGQWGGQVEPKDNGSYYTFHYSVEMTYYTTADQEKELTTAVNSLLKTLNVKNKSDYEKVKAVYDYVCNNVTYDEAHPDDGTYLPMYTAYAALVNKTAVGRGYALLIYRLLLELGVDCRVIMGQLLTGNVHAWNIVKLGNVYYNLDAALDSVSDPDMFFLRNSVLNATHYRYLDYCSLQFHTDYPMSETDYAEGVEGVPEKYLTAGTCGDDAYWVLSRDGELTISGTGAISDYKQYSNDLSVAAPWFYWIDGIRTVVVEEGITVLGNHLFAVAEETGKIESVTLPDSLTAIGAGVFLNCDKLTQIHISEKVTKIGANAFSGCRNLQEAKLTDAVVELGEGAFRDCQALKEIHIPQTLTEIADYVFRNCDGLTQVKIPDGVTKIGFGAFEGSDNLRIVTLNDKLEILDGYAFYACTSLQQIQLPDSLKQLEGSTFQRCTSLREVTIPASVEVARGFGGCTNLQSVYVYSKVVDSYAFAGCTNLRKVVLSDNVTKIGSCSFDNCDALQELVIPASVTSIQSFVIRYCDSLESIRFIGDAPGIGNKAFSEVNATCYYPAGNDTWTEDVLQQYSGNITWVPYCYHQWSGDNCDTPRTCLLCGESSGRDGHVYDDGVDGTCNLCGTHRETTEVRNVMHMFRMYDPNSGEHFYTGSTVERENLVAAGWHYEGVGFTFSMTTGAPVYRLYDRHNTFEHLYTMDVEERDRLVAEGWELEGIAFNSAYDTEVPQYRLHNPNETRGAYHFTASEEERDNLIAAGWEYQGIGFYSSWK